MDAVPWIATANRIPSGESAGDPNSAVHDGSTGST
jgi:hypothetical protein